MIEHLFALRLGVIRALWMVLAILVLAICLAGVPLLFRELQTVCVGKDCFFWQLGLEDVRALGAPGLTLSFYAWSATFWVVGSLVTFLVVATVIFWRQPVNPMAILMSFWLLVIFPTYYNPLRDALVRAAPGWNWPVAFTYAVGVWTSLIIAYLFPNGRFVPGIARLMLLPVTAYALTPIFFIDLPIGALLGFLLVGTATQVYRYRRISSAIERQQTKWVVFPLVLFTLGLSGFNFLRFFFPTFRQPGLNHLLSTYLGGTFIIVSMLLVVIFIAIAILRYRLWEIDLLIRHTLIYGVLTAALAVIYFGSVVLLQELFRGVLHQQSEIAIILSTLAIAGLSVPLHRHIQEGIDRRFYRRKYDAAKVLEAFGATVRDEVDLTALTDRLVAVVEETMQPAQVSMWLREPGAKEKQSSLRKDERF